MPQHLDHHDAELLLRLYELRREEKMRRAREWFSRDFRPDTLETIMKKYPFGSEENAFFRMVSTYWNMAASLLIHGLINEDLFFENTGELWAVWIKLEPMIAELRQTAKDPHAYENLEKAAKKYEAWMEKRAPDALAERRARFEAMAAKSK